ncbi:MAG: PDDEXK nuclease domain-containing protein [Methanomassiliicoccaceae archaeon]|nr:PDDEXK nuclease domain-containing protein [Methanomassiliicoccaceae archaeon]
MKIQAKNDKDVIKINDLSFNEIISIIERSREHVYRAVNQELISMYWEIGKYVSDKVKTEGWGRSVVNDFAQFIQRERPDLKGFSASNVWRMRQFYDIYCEDEKLALMTRDISWTSNMRIMARAESREAREFYLISAQNNNYSTRELERQMDSMLFERTMISDGKNRSRIAKNSRLIAFRDSYVLEFLDIPEDTGEKELRKAIVADLRNFILEFGKDFSFVGEEYRLQVGNKDFYIDLLFYNRGLSCLVAIELKVTDFLPEHMGQMEFYLEALDRDVRKPNENPSIGLILCTGKDDVVAEYAMSRCTSPTLISEYQLHLPDKAVLESRIREMKEIVEKTQNADGDNSDP